MATLQTMVTRILGELNRTDLSSQAEDVIRSAVEHYESQQLGFNETLTSTTVSAGVASYATPSGFLHERVIRLDQNGSTYRLIKSSWEEYQERLDAGETGRPTEYVLFGDNLYLYPTPDSQTYTLAISYTFRFPELSLSTSNVWTNAFERVIRHRAKADLLENYIFGQEALIEAQAQRAREAEAYMLLYENQAQVGLTRIRRRGIL